MVGRLRHGWVVLLALAVGAGCGEVREDIDAAGSTIDAARAFDAGATCSDPSDCDDGVFCNGEEDCVDDHCVGGTDPDCADGVDCTDDVCDEDGERCIHVPDHTQCNGEGMCLETVGCVEKTCTSDPDCNDGSYCNGPETCDLSEGSPGWCVSGSPPFCNDDISCTVDKCDVTEDGCTFEPSDELCDDGQYCNGVETCDPSADCVSGTEPHEDFIECTIDSCDEGSDTVSHVPDDTACFDGDMCDGIDSCDPAEGCVESSPLSCNDGDVCTEDLCDPDSGCDFPTGPADISWSVAIGGGGGGADGGVSDTSDAGADAGGTVSMLCGSVTNVYNQYYFCGPNLEPHTFICELSTAGAVRTRITSPDGTCSGAGSWVSSGCSTMSAPNGDTFACCLPPDA